MSDRSIFGYYDDPRATKPAYDPGLDVVCPICLLPLRAGTQLKTISLMGEHGDRSYFFRAHKSCWENAGQEERQRIEGSIIDAERTTPDE